MPKIKTRADHIAGLKRAIRKRKQELLVLEEQLRLLRLGYPIPEEMDDYNKRNGISEADQADDIDRMTTPY